MNPEKTKPDAVAASGRIEDREEPSTEKFYTDAVSDQDWESAVLAVFRIAGGDSERGQRGRRAFHMLCGGPFVSRAIWMAAESVAWIFVAAILSGDPELRQRANALTRSAMALAVEAQLSLGRAA